MTHKADDYEICCGLFNAYIAKVSNRNPNVMGEDRRVITEEEIMTLIAWSLDDFVSKNKDATGFIFKGFKGKRIEVHYLDGK